MLGLDTRRRDGTMRLAVDGGRVACPRDGDTDLEQCLACGFLDDFDDPDRPRVVRCAWRMTDPERPIDLFDSFWRPRPEA